MLNMRYKNFVWPNNPYSYALTIRRELVTHQFPGRGYCLEDLGQGVQVLTGEGEFFGEDAYETMAELLRVFQDGGAGVLVHPVVEMNQAIFQELELTQEPRADYVRYKFTFWEDGADAEALGQQVRTAGSHRVQDGETLWQIGARYDVSVEELLAANRWIQNPNSITPGRSVVIP